MSGWLQKAIGKDSLATQNVETSAADRILWEDMAQSSGAIKSLVAEGERKTPTWPALMHDAFNVFYKPQPTLRDEDDVEPAHLANRPLVKALLEEPSTEQTRSYTMLDETVSALATLEATKKMLEIVEKDQKLQDAMNQFQSQMKDAGKPGTPEYQQKAQQAAQRLQQAMQQAQPVLRKAARHGANQAGRAAEQAQQAMASWGLDPGQMRRVPVGERLALVQQLSGERFRRMAELVGRMRNIGRAQQRLKLRHHADELHSVTQGADLERVLPAELAALGHPLRRLDFGRRLLERSLLQYELRPRPRNAKGPIICLIDASGSMAGPKIEWAAAVGLALLDIARSQKRDFAAAYFQDPQSELQTFRFPRKEPADPREILRFATVGADGGTDFEKPLGWALDVQEEAAFKTADIVMVTDGFCAISDEFHARLMAAKKRKSVRILSVLIGGAPDELLRWSDRVWAITEPDDDTAGEVFAEL
jgi:uncharacterized protein with von Willebrand factor type A (vWA) domain